VPTVEPTRLAAAVARVEEPRGRRMRLVVPPQLRLYEDTRRFLAVQMAASRTESYELPADEAQLAGLVLRGVLVELPAMTADYVLYEPGTAVEEDPRMHFDVETGRSVRLLPSLAAVEEEKARLGPLVRRGGRKGREARREMEALESGYSDPDERAVLFAEERDLARLAAGWGGARYDLERPEDRARFQVRLLSCLRPAARSVLESLARAYRERFSRPLPVSSLTRTQRYQRQLRRVNRNATNVEFPPHTTGMAFDVSYRFLPPEEQNFLLEAIARLKDAGKVEALREPRNSIHVFVFRRGPPTEDAVRAFIELMDETGHPPTRRAGRPPGRRRRAG
jgi:hypothetical protein